MHTLNVELSGRVMGIIHLMGTEISTDFNSRDRQSEPERERERDGETDTEEE